MHRMEREPDELAATPHQSDADRPPVGEPLVVSRHNPAARPAWTEADEGSVGAPNRAAATVASMDGRVALVTAATGPLGVALAAELIGRGARVLLVDDDLHGLLGVTDALDPARAVPVRCDMGSDTDVSAACDFVARCTSIDVVVHVGRVGTDRGSDAPGVGRDALDDLYRTDVRGPLGLIDGLSPTMGPTPRVLLVDPPRRSHDGWSEVASDLLADHLPVGAGLRITRAACGDDLDPAVFAAELVELLGHDDVGVARVDLVGPARPTAPAGTWLDGGDDVGR